MIAVIIAAALFHTTGGEKRCNPRRATLATFNTILYSGVPEKEERTELLIEQVRVSHKV